MAGKDNSKAAKDKTRIGREFDRRTFLKISGTLASTAATATIFTQISPTAKAQSASYPGDSLDDDSDVKVMYTACMNCHSACGQKVLIKDGILIKIDGNPYHPANTEYVDGTHAARLAYATDPTNASIKQVRGRACAKAQAGIETVYNPYRIKQPLKRIGPRGSGKWEAISWTTAISEIVGGGTINGTTFTGLRALRDTSTDLSIGGNSFSGELGKVANKIVFSGGRNQHGHKEFTDRFFRDVLGTINYRHDHTSICETSHHVAFNRVSSESRAFSQSGVTHMKPDFLNAGYILLFGSSPADAGFPHTSISRKFVDGMHAVQAKVVVIDPRFSNTAALAVQNGGQWIPVKPGGDGALAMGIIRHMIDNGNYNSTFLRNATKAAATADGELCWSDATYLVRRDNKEFLNASAIGGTAGNYVCLVGGTATEADSDSTVTSVVGDLDVDGTTVASVVCDSVFNLLKKQAQEKTVAEYAALCGVSASDITAIADEFYSHGTKASAEYYRGACQHTNGTYSSLAIIYLNLLVGNFGYIGGQSWGGGHWHELGEGKTGTLYDIKNAQFNGTNEAPSGPMITRVKGDNITDFPNYFAQGPDLGQYPTKRPWYPQADNYNYQDLVPSIGAQYPYPCSALILYWNNLLYSTPGARFTAAATLKDITKVPLLVSIDIEMGETTALADYILPDTSYLETWTTPHLAPSVLTKASSLRHPVLGEFYNGTTYVNVSEISDIATTLDTYGDPCWGSNPYYRPVLPDTRTMEDILIDLAAGPQGIQPNNNASTSGHLGGIGLNGFATSQDLTKAWHWARRMIANLAFEDLAGTGVEGSGDEQDNVNYVLARGGRFADGSGLGATFHETTKSYLLHFYIETFATTINSQSGLKDFSPLGKYDAIRAVNGQTIDDGSSYPLKVITYKDSFHSMSRTICNPSLVSLLPENFVEMNSTDASARGIVTGDKVKIKSASYTGGLEGKAFVSEHIRPGVVAMRHCYGHWEMSSKPYDVSGKLSDHDPSRSAGISMNPIARLDPVLGDVAIQDILGGSVSFNDTQVQVVKI